MAKATQLIAPLNALLADELAAINQYIVHAELSANWGMHVRHDQLFKFAKDEMQHAEKLIERIVFLGGSPVVSKLGNINIGPQLLQQISNDLTAERQAIADYNEAIAAAVAANDQITRGILSGILADEDRHANYWEEQLQQLDKLGLQNYSAKL